MDLIRTRDELQQLEPETIVIDAKRTALQLDSWSVQHQGPVWRRAGESYSHAIVNLPAAVLWRPGRDAAPLDLAKAP